MLFRLTRRVVGRCGQSIYSFHTSGIDRNQLALQELSKILEVVSIDSGKFSHLKEKVRRKEDGLKLIVNNLNEKKLIERRRRINEDILAKVDAYLFTCQREKIVEMLENELTNKRNGHQRQLSSIYVVNYILTQMFHEKEIKRYQIEKIMNLCQKKLAYSLNTHLLLLGIECRLRNGNEMINEENDELINLYKNLRKEIYKYFYRNDRNQYLSINIDHWQMETFDKRLFLLLTRDNEIRYQLKRCDKLYRKYCDDRNIYGSLNHMSLMSLLEKLSRNQERMKGTQLINRRNLESHESFHLFKLQLERELSLSVRIPSISVEEIHMRNKRKLKKKKWKMKMDDDMNVKDELKKNYYKQKLKLLLMRKFEKLRSRRNDDDNVWFQLMPMQKYIDMLLNFYIEQLCLGGKGSSESEEFVNTNQLSHRLGVTLYQQYYQHRLPNRQLQLLYMNYLNRMKNDNHINGRQLWSSLLNEDDLSLNNYKKLSLLPIWSYRLTSRLGRKLFNLIFFINPNDEYELLEKKKKKGKDEKLPALLYGIYRLESQLKKGMRKEEKKSNEKDCPPQICVPDFWKEVFNETHYLSFPAAHLPMIIPPIPWHEGNRGGGLLLGQTNKLVRIAHSADESSLIQTSISSYRPFSTIFDSLNILSSCQWKINEFVLDIAIKMFQCGISSEALGLPKSPNEFLQNISTPSPPNLSNFTPLEYMEELKKWKEKYVRILKKQKEMKKIKNEQYSLWCMTWYQLSIANYFRTNIIWLPHNLDFRGRVYPLPPHFSHMGCDLVRSLLNFHEKKKLGETGLDWLKIHLTNLTGHLKKATLIERKEYAELNISKIILSAENPLNESWWMNSDDPWQTLACCKELMEAMKCDDPKEFLSSLPIHQDGSCNGLQHYAALGRDIDGARSVNVLGSGRPQDVYSDVVDRLLSLIKKDDSQLANLTRKIITRKTIKQTVMTTVYGVTPFGARKQISKQLRLNPIIIENSENNELIPQLALFLQTQTFRSLREMFTSTRSIQNWLVSCAKDIVKLRNEPVKWITPLGLPVVQPYFIKRTERINSDNYLKDKFSSSSRPIMRKQLNAFAPNFVHSLDSTHMMLTALSCGKENIRFVSIHDSFWTHAIDIDQMGKICREEFLRLHSSDILEDLSKQFISNYSFRQNEFKNSPLMTEEMNRFNRLIQQIPKKGQLNINDVLDSLYFFS
ncbi:hypothetical protein SNEBB_009641 [Seison nebaliae]|nr:hypothetical protein SNEBB_009641 [Seison nebaliae]